MKGLVVLLAAHACCALAQYPERPVRLIVPQAAGSATDTVARLLAAELPGQVGEPVGNSPEEFAAFIRSESEKWAKVAQAAGIKPE